MTLSHTLIAVLINLLWGSMFIAAVIGLREFPPILFTGIRFGLLTIILFGFLRIPKVLVVPLLKIGLVMGVGMYIVSHTYYPIPYEYMRIVKVLLVCGVVYMVRWYMEGGWLLEMGLLAMYPVLLIAIRFFNAQEVTFVKQRLRLLRL